MSKNASFPLRVFRLVMGLNLNKIRPISGTESRLPVWIAVGGLQHPQIAPGRFWRFQSHLTEARGDIASSVTLMAASPERTLEGYDNVLYNTPILAVTRSRGAIF